MLWQKRSGYTLWMQARTWAIDRLRVLEELRPAHGSPFYGIKQQLERDLVEEAKLIFESRRPPAHS